MLQNGHRSHRRRLESLDGYFEPGSPIRRVGSSPLVPLLGAGPAVLLQIAHPLVAASLGEPAEFRRGLWRRYLETLRALYLIFYGSREEADRSAKEVRRVHARIRGETAVPLGPFPAGTPYAAGDPALMLWVHASLVEVGLAVYTRHVRSLTPDDEQRFYLEMAEVARLIGVPAATIPPTLADFREYFDAQVAGPDVVVTPLSRRLAAVVLDPPIPLVLRGLVPAHRLACAGLLPPRLRAAYGLWWTPAHAVALQTAAASLRLAIAPVLAAAAPVVAIS